MSVKDQLFIASQHLVPHHALSRLIGRLAASEAEWIKNPLIKGFQRQFNIDMSDAQRKTADEFRSFNDFFTRELEPDARPIAADPKQLVSPADGAISQLGKIEHGRIFQAKGQDFSLTELLGGERERAEPFIDGQFATIYLSPRDYHRVHMPVDGTLREMVYVPGDLFSVNKTTAENVPRLFARNERLVAIFDTEFGPMAMVLVGAMIVAAIETVWAGRITPPLRQRQVTQYPLAQEVSLKKGEEMGRFLLGSTVVLCFGKEQTQWLDQLQADSPLRMGEAIATAAS